MNNLRKGFFGMNSLVALFEQGVIVFMVLFMCLLILLAGFDLVITIGREIANPPFLLLSVNELLNFFGMLMLIFIGLELLETIRCYIADRSVRVENVLLVAIIAIARKVIIIDFTQITPLMVISIAALIIALATSYFLFKRSVNRTPPSQG